MSERVTDALEALEDEWPLAGEIVMPLHDGVDRAKPPGDTSNAAAEAIMLRKDPDQLGQRFECAPQVEAATATRPPCCYGETEFTKPRSVFGCRRFLVVPEAIIDNLTNDSDHGMAEPVRAVEGLKVLMPRVGVSALSDELKDPDVQQDSGEWRLAPRLLPPMHGVDDLREVSVGDRQVTFQPRCELA